MATRFYLVPKAGGGLTGDDIYRAKYFQDGFGSRLIAGGVVTMDYGLEPVFLVAADVTPAEHTTISANSDVTALPQNIDLAVGVNLSTVTSKLDALGFPSDWVDGTTTYRQILRQLTRFLQFAQRLHAQFAVRLLPVGISLNSTVGSLSAAQQQRLRDVIATFPNGTASEVTGGMTLRAALKTLADQIPFAPRMLDTDL